MDQIKTGKFIAERRRKSNLTQLQLAEKLNITDRAISKWETGKCLPDSAIMLELCDILGITVNDLLCGEVVVMDSNKEMEKNLIEMIKQKEQADKRLLTIEIVLVIACILPLIGAALLVSLVSFTEVTETLIVLASLVPLLVAAPFAIRIEQKAGYYVCSQCGHKHVPKYASVFAAMHMGRTRYMRCPECNKLSWQKKDISK